MQYWLCFDHYNKECSSMINIFEVSPSGIYCGVCFLCNIKLHWNRDLMVDRNAGHLRIFHLVSPFTLRKSKQIQYKTFTLLNTPEKEKNWNSNWRKLSSSVANIEWNPCREASPRKKYNIFATNSFGFFNVVNTNAIDLNALFIHQLKHTLVLVIIY